MHTLSHRRRLALLAFAMLSGIGVATASPASADTIIPITWKVDATTTLKSLNMTVAVPTGLFVGTVNLTTGDLTGNLTLPPATQKISILGIPLASATFAMSSAAPLTGKVDLATMTVTVNASFNFSIQKASASLLPRLNLVGNKCRGSKPITQSLSGPVSLTEATSFTATYTIPKLVDCGPLTPILNLVIPGGGNTFTATFAPPA